jgi:hypothetical protein
MKLKPQFQKGCIYVKALNRSVNLGVATDAELKSLKDAGIDYLFEEQIVNPIPEPLKEDLEYLKKKNKKK